MSETLTKDSVLKALKNVRDPSGRDVVTLGILSEIVINKDKVYFALTVPQAEARAYEPIRKAAEDAVKAIPGVAGADGDVDDGRGRKRRRGGCARRAVGSGHQPNQAHHSRGVGKRGRRQIDDGR